MLLSTREIVNDCGHAPPTSDAPTKCRKVSLRGMGAMPSFNGNFLKLCLLGVGLAPPFSSSQIRGAWHDRGGAGD